MPASDTARLTVTFSREADLAMRAYSGAQGMRKGDLSRFIEDAVRWRMFDSAVQAVKVRNADIPPEDLYTAWSAPLPTRESNCVACQAFWGTLACLLRSHATPSRTMALRMISSLRMQATRATLAGLPACLKRL